MHSHGVRLRAFVLCGHQASSVTLQIRNHIMADTEQVRLGVKPHLVLKIRFVRLSDNWSYVMWGDLSDVKTGLLLSLY